MQVEPLVSVIIPCFNRENYIAETVDSVLDQTYGNIELFVIDDGCTDNSRNILNSYLDQLVVLEHPGRVNRGQSAGINLGLSHCEGAYVAILDSDDLFYPGKIERQVAYLQEYSEIGTVYTNGMNIDADGVAKYTVYSPGERSIIGPEPVLESSAYNLPSNALVRKQVFDKAGFLDESLRSAQDHDMAIRLAEIAPVGYIDEILWAYRRHNESISHTKTIERWQNGFKILASASKRYNYPLKTRLRRRAVLHFRLGQCFIEKKKLLYGGFHLICSVFLDPLRALRVLFGIENYSPPKS